MKIEETGEESTAIEATGSECEDKRDTKEGKAHKEEEEDKAEPNNDVKI